jgi:hypothetical protein
MIDYANLAAKAKATQDDEKLAAGRNRELKSDPCAFFARVKKCIFEEMTKANAELSKRGAAVFDRNHLPGFDEDIFLTYGTDSLCRVGLGFVAGRCMITAVISGPPNGYEISRKEYLCDQKASCPDKIHAVGVELPSFGSSPEEIAADIISSVLVGRFGRLG